MADIYEQHKAAFAQVSAYVVVKDGDLKARIVFKFPKDGSGRLYAYVHWLGDPMVRGFATGGGYDKGSAACSAAAHKMDWKTKAETITDDEEERAAFIRAIAKDDGKTWNDHVRDAGFLVFSAV